jgi:L-aspartate oxidase
METDFLVIGAGVAGMRAAVELAADGRVLVVAKDSLSESSSEYAQGGIAAALGPDDTAELHAADTLAAGDGLSSAESVRVLTTEGITVVEELIAWGAEFDREEGRLLFAREGAHSRARVLHAHGDSTGREIARTLYQKASSLANVTFQSFSAVAELLLDDHGRAAGAVAVAAEQAEPVVIHARAVLLATGGLGRVFLDTTNPDVATGDGVAMAWRAGAKLADMEFVQFHPTALRLPGAPRFLLSEALRGEGAVLRNLRGERFMPGRHPLAELAPRDVVARAIAGEMRRDGSPHVLLDISGRGQDFVKRRFPRIHASLLGYGIDLDREPAPVAPAAHYAMGGVWTGLDGRTSLDGLYAAGEVASTGVHGANRLASNSLLEGLVFGARAGRAMREQSRAARRRLPAPLWFEVPETTDQFVRGVATSHLGVERNEQGLARALEILESLPVRRVRKPGRAGVELASQHAAALLIAAPALARRESRGAHFREDCPQKQPGPAKHSYIQIDESEVLFE